MVIKYPTQNRRPGRPSSGTAGSRREELLLSAIELFGKRGFAGVSLRQIADHANADIGLSRYYFGSKEDLWKAAIDYLANLLTDDLQQISSRDFSSSTESMKAIIHWFVQMSARWPQLSRIIVFDGNDDGQRGRYVADKLVRPFFIFMSDLMEGAKAEGTLVDVSQRTIFFIITHGGSFPMALPVLTNSLPGGDIYDLKNLEAHAAAIIELVFRDG